MKNTISNLHKAADRNREVMRNLPLVSELFDNGMIKFGDFTLRSGKKSPIYIDLRDLPSFPNILEDVARKLIDQIDEVHYTCLAGLPMAGLPIAVAMGIIGRVPVIYPRPVVKEHGTKKTIEGRYSAGDQVVAVDDLITDGGTKVDLVNSLRAQGLIVNDVVVIMDREQGGKEILAANNLELHELFTLREAMTALRHTNRVTEEQYKIVTEYLANN